MSSDLIKPVKAAELARNGLVTVKLDAEEVKAERLKWEGGNAAELQVAAAYRAIEEGRQLIDLSKSLLLGGIDPTGRPKIGIAPANRKKVYVETWTQTGVVEYKAGFWHHHMEMPGVMQYVNQNKGVKASAYTPYMPPAVRRIATSEDLLLWEPQWRKHHVKRQIVIDPALLEHVTGQLYFVKAAWELTELEAAALRS